MDNRGIPFAPGKTAPRLIQDILDYDPKNRPRNVKNLIAAAPPRYRGVPLPPRKSPRCCRHALMRKASQTAAPVSDDELPVGEYVVSAYCSRCRCHFTLTIAFYETLPGQVPCHLADKANPLHHFQLVRSQNSWDYEMMFGENKYDVITDLHQFSCSAPNCPAVLEIKISPPKLHADLLKLFMDPGKLDARGRREIKKEPERYDGMSPVQPLQVLLFLRTYLLDAQSVTAGSEQKRIAKRNKKYMLSFADECDALFEYLDFTTATDENYDAEPAYFWRLPLITDINRAFLEDVLVEIELEMKERPPAEQQIARINVVSRPVSALKDIERSLGCFDYPTRSRTVDLSRDEHPYYASLGALDNFTDDLLSWAYDRQCECDPANKPYYLDCLEDLAKGRGSSDLQTKVVMITSTGEYGLKAIEDAYKFFGLDPRTTEGDEHIMGIFKSRIESAPRQKDEAKNCLLIIAKARNSEQIGKLANDKAMNFDEALVFLGVTADTSSDSIEAAAVAKGLEADKGEVARALRVIANQRGGDYTLQKAASLMEPGAGESTLDVSEAYNRLQITTRNASDDIVFNYYQSLSNGAPSGSKESYTEALRVIAFDRQSNFLFRKLDDPNADVQAETGTASQPVGLDNIGNTCYLNSLLQYYYTIKPVRDVVMDFQHYRMDLTEANIKRKRVGGRSVVKAEIVKAQKFMDELHDLFENLKTASKRSIKPTKELAELTIFSSVAEALFRRASISSPHGPPNIAAFLDAPVFGPEGPAPSVPSRQSLEPVEEDDVEMVDRPNGRNPTDGSDTSEATLVDTEPLPSYEEICGQDSVNPVAAIHTTDQYADTVMVNGDSAANDESEKNRSPPEKPPPVPPRNKSGLVIQTSESKKVTLDDDLWRFGSQQDVTEVIGNVIFRMMCAIKPTSMDEVTGEQNDNIRDTFYGNNAVYLEKAQKTDRKVESWASLMVYPSKTGLRDIYEALDIVFDEQLVEMDGTTIPQYASIDNLPPMVQILIQRTDFDQVLKTPIKNRNPVSFPETLYLDRYMDSKDPNSTLMRRRRETWKWKSQLRTLEARQTVLKNIESEIGVIDALLTTKNLVSTIQEDKIDGIEVEPALPESLDQRITEVAFELESISSQIATLRQNLTEQFTDLHEHEYKLQAVFIHRGESGGGHYWIYIYDHKNDIWREYNDEYVAVVKDRRRIFEHQGGTGGTPYYLAYVRSSLQDELVDPVYREVPEVQMTDATEASGWAAELEDEGVVMMDGDSNEGDSRHVEHAINPRPLRPKPAVQTALGGWEKDAWDQGADPATTDANGRGW